MGVGYLEFRSRTAAGKKVLLCLVFLVLFKRFVPLQKNIRLKMNQPKYVVFAKPKGLQKVLLEN